MLWMTAVNFDDQLWSEFNPLGAIARYAVAPGFQLVVVVRPPANLPILHLHDRYASDRCFATGVFQGEYPLRLQCVP
jgi:hypothetical protein